MNDDNEAIKAIAAGGPEAELALVRLYKAHRIRLLSFFIRQGVKKEEAEDMVQEVFIRVMKSAGTFRAESMVSTWLHKIARNLLIDSARKTSKEETFGDSAWDQIEASPAAKVPDRAGADIDRRRLEDCLERQFAEFRLRHPQMADALTKVSDLGWSSHDLASHLGRSNDATRQFLVQCRKRLRELLEPCAEFFMAVIR